MKYRGANKYRYLSTKARAFTDAVINDAILDNFDYRQYDYNAQITLEVGGPYNRALVDLLIQKGIECIDYTTYDGSTNYRLLINMEPEKE